MKQVLQSLKNGEVEIAEVPEPQVRKGCVLIRTQVSLLSAGTERMLLEFGKANWLDKARSQPEKARQVLEKIKTDGLGPTVTAVRSKLEKPIPLGYCNVGQVIAVGADVTEFVVGQRVVSNGSHAEMVCVPKTLCALIPDEVSSEDASFAVLAAIGLQGIRLANPTMGEVFAVTGLGLIGLLTAQLLRASGCRVLGIDLSSEKVALARKLGIEAVDLSVGEDPLPLAQALTHGHGLDGVIVTASAPSSEPIHQAATLCRKRGRIVLVGVTGLELSRADFYSKELSFQVSCSYGPGRYDVDYEAGHDYPVGFVRWTAQRNFEAVLEQMRTKRVDVASLITHRFEIHEGQKAYDTISGTAPSLGVLLEYGSASLVPEVSPKVVPTLKKETKKIVVGAIGAGNYASQVLFPKLADLDVRLKTVVSTGGVSAFHSGRKFGFENAMTLTDSVLRDPEINTVILTTRHDTHADLALKALEAGKHVFVEKPLALTGAELDRIETFFAETPNAPLLAVGFNRRFSPYIERAKELIRPLHEPKAFVITANVGAIPTEHWTQRAEGGGRIVGEACHFVDLLRFLADSPITSVKTLRLGSGTGPQDRVTLVVQFEDGSLGTIHYFANGHKSFPKERLEVFCEGKVLQLDNFRRMTGFGFKNFSKMKSWSQDKGHENCLKAFFDSISQQKAPPIPIPELIEVSRATIRAADQLG